MPAHSKHKDEMTAFKIANDLRIFNAMKMKEFSIKCSTNGKFLQSLHLASMKMQLKNPNSSDALVTFLTLYSEFDRAEKKKIKLTLKRDKNLRWYFLKQPVFMWAFGLRNTNEDIFRPKARNCEFTFEQVCTYGALSLL